MAGNRNAVWYLDKRTNGDLLPSITTQFTWNLMGNFNLSPKRSLLLSSSKFVWCFAFSLKSHDVWWWMWWYSTSEKSIGLDTNTRMASATPQKSNQIMDRAVAMQKRCQLLRAIQRCTGACRVFRGHPVLRLSRADGCWYSKAQK